MYSFRKLEEQKQSMVPFSMAEHKHKHKTNLERSRSNCLRKQMRVYRRSSFHQERKEEPTSRCAEANADPLSLNSLQECFNDVIEL